MTIGHDTRINYIGLIVSETLPAFKREFTDSLNQKSLIQIVKIIAHGFLRAYTQVLRNVFYVDYLTDIIDQVIGEHFYAICISNPKTLFYVFCNDRIQDTLDICMPVRDSVKLRKATLQKIVIESILPDGKIFGSRKFHRYIPGTAIFFKGKRIQTNLIIPSGQMSSKLRAQQSGVGTGNKYVLPHPKKSVDKQMPPLNILNLIEKQILYFCSIYNIQSLQYVVEILDSYRSEPVIVEINIAISDIPLLQDLMTQCRFSTSSNSYDDLCEPTVKIKLCSLRTLNKIIADKRIKFLSLVEQNLQYFSPVHNSLIYRAKIQQTPLNRKFRGLKLH